MPTEEMPMAKGTAPQPHRHPKPTARRTVPGPAATTASLHTGRKMLTTVKGMQIKAKKNASSQVFSHADCLCTRRGKANAPPATAARRINPKPGICGFINDLFTILLWSYPALVELPRDYSTTGGRFQDFWRI